MLGLWPALRGVRDRIRATTHEYLSTACRHKLHDQCRQTCKFCSTPCNCECHGQPAKGA